jgi:hypothetical protein
MPSGLALSSLDATMPGLWPCFEPERAMLREAPALRPDGDLLARLRRSSLKERSKSSVEVLRPRDFHRDVRPTQPPVEAESLFHQHWWLDAVAGSQWQEVTVADNGTVVGRLPYVETKTFGMRVLGMPPFTKMLGPWIAPRPGKTVTRRQRTMRIISELIEQLPSHAYFKQHLPAVWDYALPFQFAGYGLGIDQTFEIDCRRDPEELWSEMHNKTRTLIRRTGKTHNIEESVDPVEFFRLYQRNVEREGRANYYERAAFLRLYHACRAHDACTILGLRDHDGALVAGLFVVWSSDRTSALMLTRYGSEAGAGAAEMLVWQAILAANKRQQILDMDGISSQKDAHRYLHFGGELRPRLVISGGSLFIPVLKVLRRSMAWKFGSEKRFV